MLYEVLTALLAVVSLLDAALATGSELMHALFADGNATAGHALADLLERLAAIIDILENLIK